MSKPIISVVIPAYNRAGSIRAAVESALGQSVRDIEVLVVDDGSTDGTVTVAEQIDDSRVRVIIRDRNGGASAARNTGIAQSRGDFVAFLDSDDTWMAPKLAQQLAVMRQAPSAMAVCCTGAEIHLLDHGVTRTQLLEPSADWATRLAMGCDLSPGSTQLTRREAFDRIGLLDETLPRFEDWDWLLRYTQAGGRIAVVRDALARVHNRRARLGDVVEQSAKLFLRKHRAVIEELPAPLRRKAMTDLWLQVAGTFAFEGRWSATIPPILAAMGERPLHTAGRVALGAAMVAHGRATRLFGNKR